MFLALWVHINMCHRVLGSGGRLCTRSLGPQVHAELWRQHRGGGLGEVLMAGFAMSGAPAYGRWVMARVFHVGS